LVRSCTFRVTQLPKSLEISLGILRQEVARRGCNPLSLLLNLIA
jgi:hypothetical protein